MQEKSSLRIVQEKAFFLLILVTLIYFYRPIFLGEAFYYRDLFSHFVPKRLLVAEYLKQGQLPMWDPYLQGGKPLLANPNNMALYPSNLFYLIFPAPTALTIEIILHLLIGSLAAYAFCRLLGLKQESSFIAGAIFGFCGYTMSNLNLLNWLIASAYLPLLFCFWHRYLTHGNRKWWLLSVLAGALQLLAGAPELVILTFLTLLIWTLTHSYPQSISRKVFQWIILAIFVFGICLIQILPAIEFNRSSIRSVGFSFDSASVWSLSPFRILELIFPGIVGRFDSVRPGAYWGQELEGKTPFFLSIYFGISTLVIAFVGAVSGNQNRRLGFWLMILILISMLLAMGRYLPGVASVFEYFSWRLPFRFPIKWMAAAIFPVAVLAASGFETLFLHPAQKTYRLLFWCIGGLLLLLLLCSLASPALFDWASAQFQRALTPVMSKTFQHALLHAFFFWVLICVFYELKFSGRQFIAAGIVLLDLLIAGSPLRIFGPPELYTETPQLARIVQAAVQEGKLFRTENSPNYSLKIPDDSLYWKYRWQQEVLDGYLASNYRIPVIFHDDLDASSLIELNYMRLVLGKLPWDKKLPVLSAAGVTLILTPESLSQNGLRPLAKIRNASNMPLYLFANDSAIHSPNFVTRFHLAQNASQAFEFMISDDFDPNNEVILSKNPGAFSAQCEEFKIVQTKRRLTSQEFQIENGCAGLLVFSEPNYAGWKLSVDNKQTEILKANEIYLATRVDAGKHNVSLNYSPDSVRYGAILSGISLLIAVFSCLKRQVRV